MKTLLITLALLAIFVTGGGTLGYAIFRALEDTVQNPHEDEQ